MKEHTGAHVEMDKNSPHDAPTKQFFIKGTPEQIKAAKEEISKIIGDGTYMLLYQTFSTFLLHKVLCCRCSFIKHAIPQVSSPVVEGMAAVMVVATGVVAMVVTVATKVAVVGGMVGNSR